MEHKAYVRDVDGAELAVLFVHGFLGSPNHFEKFVEKVPENVAVYNVLLKGHGGDVRDFACASMAQWKSQVEKVADELVERYGSVIIVAHSMGTFFAMEAAVKHPGNVKAVMLMQSAVKIRVRATAFVNSMKALFNRVSADDPVGLAYQKAHGVKLNLRLWEYIGWVPRYIELFKEAKRARATLEKVSVPCTVFQSEKDELVSVKSVKYVPRKENIRLEVLKNSAHFIYDNSDFERMLDTFKEML